MASPYTRLSTEKELKTLVENRRAYALNHCELNVFETYQFSEMVALSFRDLVVTTMLRGKKVMHLPAVQAFDYLPGESVLVPPNVTMYIDFPEAELSNPTQCIALAIDQEQIKQTLDLLNNKYPHIDNDHSWQLKLDNFHLQNSAELSQTVARLIDICSGETVAKDLFADLALRELMVRIIQSQNLVEMKTANGSDVSVSQRFAFISRYIKDHLSDKMSIEHLSRMACMSRANFFRYFKQEFGITPIDFINSERLKMAKDLMAQPAESIRDISLYAGFSDVNYFIRTFRKMEGITPGEYRSKVLK
jgi:AraC family transcriptional regulator of arabinose operon